MAIEQLISEIRDETGGYYLSHTIGTERRLGDVGTYNKEEGFRRLRSLDHLGIPYQVRTDKDPADYQYVSDDEIKTHVSIKGESPEVFETITKAEAGVRIEFSSDFAGVFSAPACLQHEISDKAAVVSAIEAERSRSPDRDYAVVTSVADAPSATVLISQSSDAMVELEATGSAELEGFNILDVHTGFKPRASRHMRVSQVAKSGTTPLFKIMTTKEDTPWSWLPFLSASRQKTPVPAERTPDSAVEPESNHSEKSVNDLLRYVEPKELYSG